MKHLVALPTLALLAGCASGNSHVGSHFDCQAPGGTCAPMSVIDARAVAGLGHAQPIGEGSPATPSTSVHAISIGNAAPSAPPLRTSDRVLRIVFPAHIDADGVYRDESTAHAVIESSEWVDALTGPAAIRAVVPVHGTAAILPEPEKSALATLDEVIASRAARPIALAAPAATPILTAPTISQSTHSRSTSPQSLSEVAAGLSAPSVKTLDSQEPPANYDTPDVPAVQMPDPGTVGEDPIVKSVLATAAPKTVAAAELATVAPNGYRTVRWKGKLYHLPIAVPQPQRASVAPSPASSSTVVLNRAELDKARSALGFGAPASTDVGRAVQVAPSTRAKP